MRRGRNRLPTEKGVDVALAADMVYHATRDDYDVAILVAGDQDFEYLLKLIKNSLGKRVENYFFLPNRSPRLDSVVDKFVDLTYSVLVGQCSTDAHKQRRRS